MDVIMPQLGETVAEGTVTRWHKKVGDAVKADEVLFDVETDKVSTEIPAPATGVVAEILVEEGVTAKVGARLCVIRESASAAAAHTTSPVAATSGSEGTGGQRLSPTLPHAAEIERPPTAPPPAGAQSQLSPVVRRLLAEHGIDAATIKGSGRNGRITRDDVTAHVDKAKAAVHPTPSSSVRKRVAESMSKSWASVPHVLQVAEADFHRVEEARAAAAHWKDREGFTLTYLPFVARAVSIALSRYPRLNATYENEQLTPQRRINIGIAVDLNFEGLIVPVVKDASSKSLPQLAREIHDLAVRARAGKLKPDELTEGTYTITNNGAFGTVITAPIINVPQVAILSTDSVRKKPVVIETGDGDGIAIRPVGVLGQSFDHRAVDGAYAAAFLRELKLIIETRVWSQDLNA